MNEYPRESDEMVEFEPVLVNSVPTASYTWQLTEQSERPTGTWAPPVDLGGGALGFPLVPAARGVYRVWVKIAAGGKTPVVLAGELRRT